MSEHQDEKNLEMKIEKVDIVEDEKAGGDESTRTWQEEFQVAGGELVDFLKKVMHEVNVRRITVKNRHGRVILDIPAAVGAFGLLPPLFMWTVVAFGVAVVTNCSVTIERVEKVPAEETPETV